MYINLYIYIYRCIPEWKCNGSLSLYSARVSAPMCFFAAVCTFASIAKGIIPEKAFKWDTFGAQEHQLTLYSVPADWFRAFIPNTLKKGCRVGFCTDQWATYSNMVPKMYFAGQSERGGGRRKFTEFTPR